MERWCHFPSVADWLVIRVRGRVGVGVRGRVRIRELQIEANKY